MNDPFDPGFDITTTRKPFGFLYGRETFGPDVEIRRLDDIRKSLLDPHCDGPEEVYAIAMDVGKNEHKKILIEMHLLYGAVTYAAGKLGSEPVRSQGHIHKQSEYANGWSTPEVYEIWKGNAIIYMQESAEDDPGRCFAVYAKPGDIVIVPPGWPHATISADTEKPLTFGAWCDRDFGFDYDDLTFYVLDNALGFACINSAWPNENRGFYKTIDGGQNWQNVSTSSSGLPPHRWLQHWPHRAMPRRGVRPQTSAARAKPSRCSWPAMS